jgi:hypothetical protein
MGCSGSKVPPRAEMTEAEVIRVKRQKARKGRINNAKLDYQQRMMLAAEEASEGKIQDTITADVEAAGRMSDEMHRWKTSSLNMIVLEDDNMLQILRNSLWRKVDEIDSLMDQIFVARVSKDMDNKVMITVQILRNSVKQLYREGQGVFVNMKSRYESLAAEAQKKKNDSMVRDMNDRLAKL